MQMNQIAYAYNTEAQRDAIKLNLGLMRADWVRDTVRSEVKVLGQNGYETGSNVAELEFCMAMGGTQFELIRYIEGPNWLSKAEHSGEVVGMQRPYVAHVGFHLDEGEGWPPIQHHAQLVQEAWTVSHTNEEVNRAGRRYHYRIYKLTNFTFMKFIKRIQLQPAAPHV